MLPDAGYLHAVGALARKYDAVWIIDETHTISAGYGGMTAQYGLAPDMMTIGMSAKFLSRSGHFTFLLSSCFARGLS